MMPSDQRRGIEFREGGEVVDAAVDVGVGGLEGLVGVDADRVGYRPSAAGAGRVEFLVGVVADRDDQVAVSASPVLTASGRPRRGQSVPSSVRDRARVDAGPRGGCRRMPRERR